MLVGDATASWVYNTDTLRVSNNAAANKARALVGLAEEPIRVEFVQRLNLNASAAGTARSKIAIGVNATAISGKSGWAATVATGVGSGVPISTTTQANSAGGYTSSDTTTVGGIAGRYVAYHTLAVTLFTALVSGGSTIAVGAMQQEMDAVARHIVAPAIGLQEIFCLERTPNTIGTGSTFYGTAEMMVLTVNYRG